MPSLAICNYLIRIKRIVKFLRDLPGPLTGECGQVILRTLCPSVGMFGGIG